MAKQWEGGKGDNSRPMAVSRQKFEDNWDRIFKKPKEKPKEEKPVKPSE